VVTDGTALGHPCCGVFCCTDDLENNRHRFCRKHDSQHGICAIVDCNEPVQERAVGPHSKACGKAEHQKMERLNFEKGNAAFTLTEHLQKRGASYSTNVLMPHQTITQEVEEEHLEEDLDEDNTWFEADRDGNIKIFTEPDPGTTAGGIDDEEPGPCPAAKSELGNRKLKAQFGRRRTHSEQLLVRPCGVIVARATFFGAEAVSNVLVCYLLSLQ
jgi:hypothetical protein